MRYPEWTRPDAYADSQERFGLAESELNTVLGDDKDGIQKFNKFGPIVTAWEKSKFEAELGLFCENKASDLEARRQKGDYHALSADKWAHQWNASLDTIAAQQAESKTQCQLPGTYKESHHFQAYLKLLNERSNASKTLDISILNNLFVST